MKKHRILKGYIPKDFKRILYQQYEKEKADSIYLDFEKLCLNYAKEYSSISKKEETHYFEQILPFIAVYNIMNKVDVNIVNSILQTIIENRSDTANRILGTIFKIPNLYRYTPKICDKIIMKQFSEDVGFKYGKTETSKLEWKADIIKCPYYETCKKFNCTEIAHYFCDSDDLIYGKLHKNILWKRTKTLGRGNEVCDFNIEIKEKK